MDGSKKILLGQFCSALRAYLVVISMQKRSTLYTVGSNTLFTEGPNGTYSCYIDNPGTIQSQDQSQEAISEKIKSIVTQMRGNLIRPHGE